MRTIVEPLPHDLAVKAALETLGRPVGFGQAPAGSIGTNGLPTTDYLVLYPINSVRSGTLNDPYADADLVYQVTIVARMPEAVRDIAGEIEAALLGVTVTGRVISQVIPEDFDGVFPDRDVGPPHPYYGTPRVRLRSVPA